MEEVLETDKITMDNQVRKTCKTHLMELAVIVYAKKILLQFPQTKRFILLKKKKKNKKIKKEKSIRDLKFGKKTDQQEKVVLEKYVRLILSHLLLLLIQRYKRKLMLQKPKDFLYQ